MSAVVDQALTGSDGFYITDAAAGTLIKLGTASGNVYHLLVIDPAEHLVVLQGDANQDYKEGLVMFLRGSTSGGSATRIGWIGRGLRPVLNVPGGGVGGTSTRWSWEIVEDEERQAKLQAVFDKFQVEEAAKPVWTDGQFWTKVEEIVREHFPEETWERTITLLKRFCRNGMATILGFLDRAREADKLDQAFEVMDRHFREYWGYVPPTVRGEFNTQRDVDCINSAYRELDLPIPTHN